MVNKKGFLRTIEAVIAVIMILGLILYVTPSKITDIGEIPTVVEQSQNLIVEEIALNKTLRGCIQQIDSNSCITQKYACTIQVDGFIKESLPPGYNYGCEVCPSAVSCINVGGLPKDRTVYTRDTFISGRPQKVFRIYMWELTPD